MTRSELVVALNLIQGLGPVTIGKLLAAFESPEALFQSSRGSIQSVLGRWATDQVLSEIPLLRDGKLLAREMELCRRFGVQIVTLLDEGYPKNLKSIHDPPAVLYVRGGLLEEDAASIAMVGTRSASSYGLSFARQLAAELACAGLTIVSGLAEGIDGASHEGALEAKGRTIAVLGHGLSHLYPSQHRRLAERIAASGALVSEFPMAAEPQKDFFPRRNRVISGLSLGVVVVEAPPKSGALITAYAALEQGREVFAVPGPAGSLRSKGTHQLIKEGAKLVENAQDVLEEVAVPLKAILRSRFTNVISTPDQVGGRDLSEEESVVFDAIPEGLAVEAESLSQATRVVASRLLPVLTGLELKGLIQQVPGQGYSRR